jgi:hypothetical protein
MSIYLLKVLAVTLCELLAAVSGFVYWNKIRDSYWKWFPFFLLIIFITEVVAIYLSFGLKRNDLNVYLYGYFGIPLQFLFYCWLIAQYLKPYKERKWPLFGAAIYVASWIVDMAYLSAYKFVFTSFSYTVGNVVLLVLIILFFVKFINSEDILKYKLSMMFWVCLGLLVFFLGTFPFYALRNTLYSDFRKVFYVYHDVNFVLVDIMYILFCIAFIWGKPR